MTQIPRERIRVVYTYPDGRKRVVLIPRVVYLLKRTNTEQVFVRGMLRPIQRVDGVGEVRINFIKPAVYKIVTEWKEAKLK